ncbi:uncharacterized protein UV8b_03037 [Ustilaginoidea virens]|uniref:Diphthine methyltransferase n=1 Tax=Ustilaginoidea virens TaxID=1159556 RepID=A0A8E5MGF6_USTVR|nr:uncharacterized protein UV8b_03037 [Ustilaginoidea virens]QUC18796.1 hypothetical protein UV8b_03037 [Ustilaginoidea virens]
MCSLSPISSVKQLQLDLPPSCVQVCPFDPSYFIVGTYNLENSVAQAIAGADEELEATETATKKKQDRNGTLVLFRLDDDDKVVKVQTESQPSAVLDLKFHGNKIGGKSIVAVVSSTGSLAIFALNPERHPLLQHLATSRCDDIGEDVLFLQCNWHPAAKRTIAVTTSSGLARLLYLDENWCITEWTDLGIQNTLEAWSVAFSDSTNSKGEANQPTTVYCGGDDSIMRYTSWSCSHGHGAQTSDAVHPVASIRGCHDAGVTAILPLPRWAAGGGRVVLTGSYDDHLRVLAIHDLHESHGAKKAQLLGDINLGGGVWRLDLIDMHPRGSHTAGVAVRVLASCMHAGVRIVGIHTDDGQTWTCELLARFEEHKSMNYAADFVRKRDGKGLACISTSFYDRLLCLWEYPSSPCGGSQVRLPQE